MRERERERTSHEQIRLPGAEKKQKASARLGKRLQWASSVRARGNIQRTKGAGGGVEIAGLKES